MPFVNQGRRISKACGDCGTIFCYYASEINRQFCSRECANNAKRVQRIPSICKICGNEIISRSTGPRLYCGHECAIIGARLRSPQQVRRECLKCGTEFWVIPCRIKRGGGKFCSRKCSSSFIQKAKPNRQGLCLDRSRPGLVYQAVNAVNGKRYIGATSQSLNARAQGHFAQARQSNTSRGAAPFIYAIRKYGHKAFAFSVLVCCESMVEAFSEEKRLIVLLKPEYNATKGGEGTVGVRRPEGYVDPKKGKPGYWLGKKRSPETVAKITAAVRGRKLTLSPEAIEIRRQQAAAMRSRPKKAWTEERRNAASERLIGRDAKKVICINDGKIFSSQTAAEIGYGLSRGSVSAVIRGVQKTTGGLRFRFVE